MNLINQNAEQTQKAKEVEEYLNIISNVDLPQNKILDQVTIAIKIEKFRLKLKVLVFSSFFGKIYQDFLLVWSLLSVGFYIYQTYPQPISTMNFLLFPL